MTGQEKGHLGNVMLSHHRFRDGGAGGGRGRAHLRVTYYGAMVADEQSQSSHGRDVGTFGVGSKLSHLVKLGQ